MHPTSSRWHPPLLACVAFAVGALAAAWVAPAHAAEPYVAAGFPFLVVGVAQPINPMFAVRADYGLISNHRYSGSTSDDDFRGDIRYHREALLGDWFVAEGGFRLTGGAMFTQARAALRATPHDGKISIGGIAYNAPGSTYFAQSELSLPKTAPYVGLGWGHHQAPDAGFSFNFDAGAAFGTARASPLSLSPALASELAVTPGSQADVTKENHDLQDEVHKLKALPQLTIGVGYKF